MEQVRCSSESALWEVVETTEEEALYIGMRVTC